LIKHWGEEAMNETDELRQQLEASQIHNEKQLIEISRLRKALKKIEDRQIFGCQQCVSIKQIARKALEVMRNDRRT